MGIYGLTTYVEANEEELFKHYQLHDSIILMDGNSTAAQVYSISGCNHAFGGDYDKYSNKIREFVSIFKKCNITTIFLFDGAYEKRKLSTVLDRMKINVYICGRFKDNYKQSKCFPLLLRDVFKDTIRECNLPIIQSDFEADQELIILSRLTGWPVVSYDSDFLLSDIRYIPFNTLKLQPKKLRNSNQKYYIGCKLYCIDNLLNKFGGLENKSLLPLMSSLLGNDYIIPNMFRGFLSIKHTLSLENKIEKIIKWLRRVPSVDSAIREMVCNVPVRHKKGITILLNKLIEDYTRQHSYLLSYVPANLLDTITDQQQNVSAGDHVHPETLENEKACEHIEYFCDSFEIEHLSICDNECELSDIRDDNECKLSYIIENNDSNECITCDTYDNLDLNCMSIKNVGYSDHPLDTDFHHKIPDWLYTYLRKGLISPTVLNLIYSRRIFIQSQPEDYSLAPSHEISLPILQIIAGLALNDGCSDNSDKNVKCHARKRLNILGVYNISPSYGTMTVSVFPTLVSIIEQAITLRRMIIFDTVDLNSNICQDVPEDWVLFILSLVYWSNKCKSPVITKYHTRAAILCAIYLRVIDNKIGYVRTKKFLRKIQVNQTRNEIVNSEDNCVNNYDKLEITGALKMVSSSDCLTSAYSLLDYHYLSHRAKFNIKIMHAYAQLQSVLQNIIMLNGVLAFPFKTCEPSNFLSGTFLYNSYNDLDNRKFVDEYVTRTFLSKSPSIISLYRKLTNKIDHIVCFQINNKIRLRKKKTCRKKNKKSKQVIEEGKNIKDEEISDEDNIHCYSDPNNIYSLLADCNIK